MPFSTTGMSKFFVTRSMSRQLNRAWWIAGSLDGCAHTRAPPLVALGNVALAAAVAVGVDRKAERVIAVVDGPADMVIDPIGIAIDVKLEDFEGLTRGFGGFFEPGMRAGAQDHAVAELAGGRGDGGAATRLEHLEPADGRAQHRDA